MGDGEFKKENTVLRVARDEDKAGAEKEAEEATIGVDESTDEDAAERGGCDGKYMDFELCS